MKKTVENYVEPGIFDLKYYSRTASDVDGCGVIAAMFNTTDDDGSFLTCDYRADSITEDPDGPTLYFIDWSGDTPAEEIDQYKWFRSTLQEIAGYIGEDRKIPLRLMPAPLAAFASVYLMPAEAFYNEEESAAANMDLDMLESGYFFDDDRIAQLKAYEETVELDAKRRVGSGPLAHDFVRRCQRVLMLLAMGAPDFILKSEERKLAYTMVIHYRAERVK